MNTNESTVELEQLDKCPICGHEVIDSAFARQYADFTLMISFCSNCHTIFNNPRMSDEYTKKYYSGVYRDTIAPNENGINPNDLEIQERRAKLQVEIVGQYIEGIKSVLEIGSSAGWLLNELQKMGAEKLTGVEPDVRYHEIEPAAQFDCKLDIDDVEPYPYDLVCMSHSLEHLNHPLEYMQNIIANYTHKGSRIMIEVPNTEYYQCFGLAHPFNFTPETLNGLFLRAGCRVVQNFTHGMDTRMVYRFLMGLYEV